MIEKIKELKKQLRNEVAREKRICDAMKREDKESYWYSHGAIMGLLLAVKRLEKLIGEEE